MKPDRTGYAQHELCDCGVPRDGAWHPVSCFPTFLGMLTRRFPYLGTRDCPISAKDHKHLRRVFMEWTDRIMHEGSSEIERVLIRGRMYSAERYVQALVTARGLPIEPRRSMRFVARIAPPPPTTPAPVTVATPKRRPKLYVVGGASASV